MTATELRDRAGRLASTDPVQALSTARSIDDPWFACQALAWVARFAPENKFSRIVRESFRTASAAKDPYRVVAASAWPARAVVERGQTSLLTSVVPELLEVARTIEPSASRSEALFLLFQAVFPAGQNTWQTVFDLLLTESMPITHWRQRRNLHDAMLIVWNEDEQMVTDIVSRIDDSKLKQQITKSLAAEKHRSPRSFFWTNAAYNSLDRSGGSVFRIKFGVAKVE